MGNVKRYAKTWKSGRDGHIVKSLPESKVKTRISAWGYELCTLHKDGKKHTKRVHVLVAEAFLPNLYGKSQVNHKDGNKLNNSILNLEWCTPQENIKHAFAIGAHDRKSQFDLHTRQKIWDEFLMGSSVSDLAKKYNTTYSYMYGLTVMRQKDNRKSFKVHRLSNEKLNNQNLAI